VTGAAVAGRVVVVDHRDSFAFLLGEQFARRGAAVESVRCDVALAAFQDWLASTDPDLVVLSPGPGRPEDTGVTLPWLATDPSVPILGVCLGHQAMAVAAGGRVGHAPVPVHGRASVVHVGGELPRGNALARAFLDSFGASTPVARYHSLTVTVTGDDHVPLLHTAGEPAVLMAMAHRSRPRLGLQFHPESVLTPGGGRMVERVLDAAVASRTSP